MGSVAYGLTLDRFSPVVVADTEVDALKPTGQPAAERHLTTIGGGWCVGIPTARRVQASRVQAAMAHGVFYSPAVLEHTGASFLRSLLGRTIHCGSALGGAL